MIRNQHRVGIQGRHIPEWERKDAILIFVIDVSGSMKEGHKMDMVKHGLRRLVDQLGPNDLVGIVAFSRNAWVVLDPTSVHYRQHILRAINRLRPRASTNTEATRSRIEDADFADAQRNLTRYQILQQVGATALNQSIAAPQLVLTLIR